MAKIGIGVAERVDNAKAAAAFSKITGLGVSTILKTFHAPRQLLFFCGELYMNDHPRVSRNIIAVLEVCNAHEIRPFIIEIGHDEAWEDVNLSDPNVQITPASLRNLIDEPEFE